MKLYRPLLHPLNGEFLQSSGYHSSSLFHSDFHSLDNRVPGPSSPTLAMNLSPPAIPPIRFLLLLVEAGYRIILWGKEMVQGGGVSSTV
jgi:hypothetical protein